jgi:heme-degrading monooxygenase HmoA
MISRQWRGLTRAGQASAYVRHLKEETFPALRRLSGFRGASILKRDVGEGVEFLIVTEWDSLDAIRAFAGADVEVAVVPPAVQAMMIEFDRSARHYELVERQ